MLSIHDTNKYGDRIYSENVKTNMYPLPEDVGFWSIIKPSAEIIQRYPQCEMRVYNDIPYLLSTKAAETLTKKTDCFGATAILSFIFNDTRYFIMTVDNKDYVQNPQGGGKDDEDPQDCIKRELWEELRVKFTPEQCKEIGYWKFSNYNQLVNANFKHFTKLYFIEVELSQVKHLILGDLMDLDIFDTKKYSFILDETKYVIFCTDEIIKKYSDTVTIGGKKYRWNGHQREAILRILGESKYDTSYLQEFKVIDFKI